MTHKQRRRSAFYLAISGIEFKVYYLLILTRLDIEVIPLIARLKPEQCRPFCAIVDSIFILVMLTHVVPWFRRITEGIPEYFHSEFEIFRTIYCLQLVCIRCIMLFNLLG